MQRNWVNGSRIYVQTMVESTAQRYLMIILKKGNNTSNDSSLCPEQNGSAERMNRTLVEAAHSMMFHAGMPKQFWGEAIHTAAYVHNRSPTSYII